jgi:DNA-binding CsgD family transcriptional regulator
MVDTRLSELSPAERTVVAAALRGLSVREMATELVLGEATVKTHLAHIYAKLGVRGRIELLANVQSLPVTASSSSRGLPAGEVTRPALRGVRKVAKPFLVPGLLVLLLSGSGLVASLVLQPAGNAADLERLLAVDGVQAMELEGSTLHVTTQWSSETEIRNVERSLVRQLAVEHSVPLSVTSAVGVEWDTAPITLVAGVIVALVLAASLVWRRPRSRLVT